MDCLPPSLTGRKYYQPTDRGFEKEIKRRLDGWAEIKLAASSRPTGLRFSRRRALGTPARAQIRWKFFSISRRDSRSTTGRPWGQTLEYAVRRSSSRM
jgi:hypothetical protein